MCFNLIHEDIIILKSFGQIALYRNINKNTNMAEQDSNKKQNTKGNSQQPKKPNFPNMNNPKGGFNITWIYAALFIVFIAINFMDLGGGAKEVNDSQFYTQLQANEVERVVIINKEFVEVYLKSNPSRTPGIGTPDYKFTIASVDFFLERVQAIQDGMAPEQKISVSSETRHNY